MDNFFKDSGKIEDVVLIGSKQESHLDSLASTVDIQKEVQKEYVNNAIIEESNVIEYPMICINASKITSITSFALEGLKALILDCEKSEFDVDDTIPVYMATPEQVLKIGKGSYNKLYLYLDTYVKTAINKKLKVYYFESEKKKERVDRGDPTKIRLNI